MIATLEARKFPVDELVPLASERSVGSTVEFHGEEIEVRLAEPSAFDGIDIVLSSAGGSISQKLLPEAAARGAVSIDNTSAFRMDPDVPLVVPEVNAHRIADYKTKRIIANPNCSTIQLVVALKPLHDAATVKNVVVSTYQAVSGGGQKAMDELFEQTRGLFTQNPTEPKHLPHRIAFNLIPQIDVFLDDGATKEEWKMRAETPKIMEADIDVHATCVRVPVFYSHSEAAWIETARDLSPDEARALLNAAPGVTVIDEPAELRYPMPADVAGEDDVAVGRIRRHPGRPHTLAMWIVGDNVRKGAALNAVQIAEQLIELWQREGRA
jgi:aspartate-semialdehyde dehydrogenase